jgi:hypothetical protein
VAMARPSQPRPTGANLHRTATTVRADALVGVRAAPIRLIAGAAGTAALNLAATSTSPCAAGSRAAHPSAAWGGWPTWPALRSAMATQWTATEWAADLVPHLAYGAVAATTYNRRCDTGSTRRGRA